MPTPEPMLLPFNEEYDGTDVNPGGNPTRFITGAEDGLTAHAGGGQANALPLSTGADIHRITTCATIGDSVKLPPSIPGLEEIVINNGATSLNVFPQTGDQINALAVNTAFAVAAGKTASFYCPLAGAWHSILSA